ncbi:hypothetical protein BT96DRAFT_74025 [Gymnopus androsaceus JB14]|uniref:Secreted protein n=1 Tax=Gymnopus androsaceus JB14 TaxID=1447944 RepID=A0A6A4GD51_9AGAR|nr:hypothetical protein BT96DRAFT_74025 [Gymnopus androsaceus JB14]
MFTTQALVCLISLAFATIAQAAPPSSIRRYPVVWKGCYAFEPRFLWRYPLCGTTRRSLHIQRPVLKTSLYATEFNARDFGFHVCKTWGPFFGAFRRLLTISVFRPLDVTAKASLPVMF